MLRSIPLRFGKGASGRACCALLLALGGPADASDEVHFDRGLLRSLGLTEEVASFEKNPAALPPGSYELELSLNKVPFGAQPIRIVHDAEQRQLYCFDAEQLRQWGVLLPESAADDATAPSDCFDPLSRIPQSRIELDAAAGTLHLTLPQAYVKRLPRNYAPPQSWDAGINAGFISYTANADRTRNREDQRNDLFVGLNSGLNLGHWRLRHNGNLSHGDSRQQGSAYRSLGSYAQRDLTGLSSQLTLGQYFTPGDLFDSVPFSGAQLESDERMLPESQRGFAPVVRGVAESNATVKIHQGHQLVYQTSVPPGPFVIDDLYPTGYSDDLRVSVIEADGRERTFSVPYGHSAELLRPGVSRYQASAGHLREEDVGEPLAFVQGGYRRGLSNHVSAYTGGVVAESYMATLLGGALNTPYGVLSMDATVANFSAGPGALDASADSGRGKSYRVTYGKSFGSTNLQLSYRRSDADYLDLSTAAQALAGRHDGQRRERDRLQLNLSQPLLGGSLYLSGMGRSYWSGETRNLTFSGGYSRSFSWGSLSLSTSRFHSDDGYANQYLLSLSLPLGTSAGSPRLSSSVTYEDARNRSLQNNLSGRLGERQQWGYNLYGNHSLNEGDGSQSYGASLNLRGAASQLGASVARGEGFSRESLSARGTLVGYAGGVVLSPSQGETMAIVEAEGAGGARVSRGNGRLDSSGKALITGLTPYRHNDIGLDADAAAEQVEIREHLLKTAPRHGAIVHLRYATRIGTSVLLELRRPGGAEVPFGAEVRDAKGDVLAHVGQDSLAYLYLEGDQRRYRVAWGGGAEQQCTFDHSISDDQQRHDNYRAVSIECRTGEEPA